MTAYDPATGLLNAWDFHNAAFARLPPSARDYERISAMHLEAAYAVEAALRNAGVRGCLSDRLYGVNCADLRTTVTVCDACAPAQLARWAVPMTK